MAVEFTSTDDTSSVLSLEIWWPILELIKPKALFWLDLGLVQEELDMVATTWPKPSRMLMTKPKFDASLMLQISCLTGFMIQLQKKDVKVTTLKHSLKKPPKNYGEELMMKAASDL